MPQPDLLNTETLTPSILEILQRAPLPGLDGSPQCVKTRRAIEIELQQSHSPGALSAAGLWLLAGELDLSHAISQSDKSSEGSFWHGVMHRREGDFWNSKYWFRQVGKHSVHAQLAQHIGRNRSQLTMEDAAVQPLLDPLSLPATLVDYCEAVQSGRSKAAGRQDLELICWWEWQLLFLFCM